jgi:hypothetical protein
VSRPKPLPSLPRKSYAIIGALRSNECTIRRRDREACLLDRPDKDRRYRQRLRRNATMIAVEVSDRHIASLCRLHWLDAGVEVHSKAEIGSAIARILDGLIDEDRDA